MTRPTRRLRVETLEDRAVPATHTWIDGPNSNNWSDATNWVGGSVPTSGEVGGTIVVLGVADTPNQDIAGLVIDRLEFSPNTGGVLLTLGQPLTINGGVTPSVRSVSGNNLIEGSTLTLAVSTITVSVETAPLSGDQLVIDSAVVGSQPVQKTGPGRLLLRSPASSFTGNLTVAAGRLIPFNAPGGLDPVVGPLGNPQVAGRTITVAAGASLDFFTGDVFGNPSSTPLVTLSVAGSLGIGTVSTNALGPVVLNGGTIVADNGLAIDNRTWNLRGGSVTVIGSQPSTLTLGAVPANDRLGFHLAATTLFDVADATGTAATDLIVNAVLADQSSSQGGAAGGATFQGAGTVALNAANTYTGPTLVAGAELLVNGSTISATTVAADGVLGGRGTKTRGRSRRTHSVASPRATPAPPARLAPGTSNSRRKASSRRGYTVPASGSSTPSTSPARST